MIGYLGAPHPHPVTLQSRGSTFGSFRKHSSVPRLCLGLIAPSRPEYARPFPPGAGPTVRNIGGGGGGDPAAAATAAAVEPRVWLGSA